MRTKILIFAFTLSFTTVFAQSEQENTVSAPLQQENTFSSPKRQETLFRNAHIRGGFASPIFSWSSINNKTGYGAGGGAGVVFDHFFLGLFGMGETFDSPVIGTKQLVLGYGGLWIGYTVPSHKLLHLYTSLKIAGGSVGETNFVDDWNIDNNWYDVTFVAIPEAGLELNIARWFRLIGSVGYRFVEGFEGYESYGKKDLNAPVYNLALRFGKFGK